MIGDSIYRATNRWYFRGSKM